jgi:hypothetical protein
LTSLEGAPKELRGYFVCNGNPLTDLKGIPEKIGKDFVVDFPTKEMEKAFEKMGQTMFLKWIHSGIPLKDFEHAHRGTIIGKKFGL